MYDESLRLLHEDEVFQNNVDDEIQDDVTVAYTIHKANKQTSKQASKQTIFGRSSRNQGFEIRTTETKDRKS